MQPSRTPGPSRRAPESGAPAPDERDRSAAPLRLAAAAAALSMLASALVVGDVWSTSAGVLTAVAAVVLGIVALVHSGRSTSRAVVVGLAVLGIVWGGFGAVGGGVRLLVWPAAQVYQECTENALTLSSSERCEQQFQDNAMHQVSGRPLETGFPGASDAPSPRSTTPGTTPSPSASASGRATPTPHGSSTATTGAHPSATASATP
ncbi:hypothetical protein KVA01_05320 [Kocuria varians]|uniref:Uncharacterized protein n=1 Tax=Kocuria varians TaxID=1272 RepID=A0A4Y4D514_KOCVA|nr:hypothetical protein [Kocuria varians]GEC98377.1 hypothetical protein KVA01_05320 [Kocuria varians]